MEGPAFFMSDIPTDRLETLWSKHVAHCWHCADLSQVCMVGQTLETELLKRWSKEFHSDPEKFCADKEMKLDGWRKLWADNQQERIRTRIGLPMAPAGNIPDSKPVEPKK